MTLPSLPEATISLPSFQCVPTALLGAGLDDGLAGVHGAHHFHSLFNGMHDGLFDISVLAGIHRVNQHLLVPVVGAANQHGVDILAVQNFMIVGVSLGAGAGDFQSA